MVVQGMMHCLGRIAGDRPCIRRIDHTMYEAEIGRLSVGTPLYAFRARLSDTLQSYAGFSFLLPLFLWGTGQADPQYLGRLHVEDADVAFVSSHTADQALIVRVPSGRGLLPQGMQQQQGRRAGLSAWQEQ